MSQFQETNLNHATDVDDFLPYVTIGSELPFTEALSTFVENFFSLSQVFCHLISISLKLYLSTKLIIIYDHNF